MLEQNLQFTPKNMIPNQKDTAVNGLIPTFFNSPLKKWSQLFKDSIAYTWARKWRFVFLATVPCFLATLPLILIFFIYAVLRFIFKDDGGVVLNIVNVILGIAGILSLISIIVYALNWPRACYVYTIFNSTASKEETLRMGRKKVWGLFWVELLKSLVVWGGLLLLIIPGIVWSIKYGLAPYAFLIEGKRGGKALKRSAELSKGYRWAIFKRVILFSGFQPLIQIIFALAFFLVNVFGGLGTVFTIISFVLYLGLSLSNMLISLLFGSFGVVYDSDIYQNLLLNKENKTENEEKYTGWQKLWTLVLIFLIPLILLVGVLPFFLIKSEALSMNSLDYLMKFLPNNEIVSSLNQVQNQTEPDNSQVQLEEILNLYNNSSDETNMGSEDLKKISDVETAQSILEIYFNTNGRYPIAENNVILGQGEYAVLCNVGFVSLSDVSKCYSSFLSLVFENSQQDDGDYTYQSYDGKTYTINFMIETPSNGFEAGELIATPSGIKNKTEDENLNLDSDGDGLTDIEEEEWRTDPNYSDSDYDGYLDGEEVQNGYNPLGPGKMVTDEL